MSQTPRRALIAIDIQNEYVTGNLLIEFPDIRLSLANIARAMDAARAADIPVIVVQNTAPAGAPVFDKGTHGWQLHEVVTKRAHDHYIEKTLPSAYAGTDLGDWLAGQRIDTLVVTGYMTHNCVDSTIKHALHSGLAVEVLYDATGSLSYANRAGTAGAEQIHKTHAVVWQSRFAAVLTTDEWLQALETGVAPERDSLFKSNQRARLGLKLGERV